jgi:uncharacterized protein (TIGR03083 family)
MQTDMPADEQERPAAVPFDPVSAIASPQELADVYRATRQSITALLRGLPASRAALFVPATPAWNVRDLTAHMLHVCREARQPEDGVTYQPGVPVAELLELWAATAEPLEARFREIEPLNRLKMVMDGYTHEQDLRLALGLPQTVRHPAFPIALALVVLGFSLSLGERGLPSVAFETPDRRCVAGAEPVGVTVRGPSHAVYRALTGRRSREQIMQLDWSGDPAPFLPAFSWGPFHPPRQIVES